MAEFSPATASAMGLAWAYHEHCRAGMEAEFLPALFAHGRDLAAGAAPAAAAGGAEAAGVCGAAVSLLCAVLSWDFRCGLAALAAGVPGAAGARGVRSRWLAACGTLLLLLHVLCQCMAHSNQLQGAATRTPTWAASERTGALGTLRQDLLRSRGARAQARARAAAGLWRRPAQQ